MGQGYVFTCVCYSVHRGGWYPSMHCRWYSSMPCSRSPGRVISQHALQVSRPTPRGEVEGSGGVGSPDPHLGGAKSIIFKASQLHGSFLMLHFLPPAMKLGQGYVFTHVCDSVHRGMVSQHALQVVFLHALQQVSRGAISQHALQVSRPTPRGKLRGLARWGLGPTPGGLQAHRGVSRPTPRGCVSQHALRQIPPTATAAGGTHPTGMHSCYLKLLSLWQN